MYINILFPPFGRIGGSCGLTMPSGACCSPWSSLSSWCSGDHLQITRGSWTLLIYIANHWMGMSSLKWFSEWQCQGQAMEWKLHFLGLSPVSALFLQHAFWCGAAFHFLGLHFLFIQWGGTEPVDLRFLSVLTFSDNKVFVWVNKEGR